MGESFVNECGKSNGEDFIMEENQFQPLKEAEYYISQSDGVVVCNLCPHECRLAEGKSGFCKNRINQKGHLYSLAYGKVCALNVDPIEKKPLFHFLMGERCLSLAAAGCNLSCLNCQNWTISQVSPLDVPYQLLLPGDCARLAKAHHCKAVAYTYTEPLTYLEYVRDCASETHEAGLKNILVTAGYVKEKPLCDLLPFIDAVNIDLKSFSDVLYKKISHVHLQPVLNTLKQLRDAGIWLEITNLLIPTVNDEKNGFRMMCQWLVANGFAENPLHISRFFPRYRLQQIEPTSLSVLLSARKIAMEEGMHFVYIGNTCLPDIENTYCPHCGVLLIKREGYQVTLNGFLGNCPICGRKISGVWF